MPSWASELLVGVGSALTGGLVTVLVQTRVDRRERARKELVKMRDEISTLQTTTAVTAATVQGMADRLDDTLDRINTEHSTKR